MKSQDLLIVAEGMVKLKDGNKFVICEDVVVTHFKYYDVSPYKDIFDPTEGELIEWLTEIGDLEITDFAIEYNSKSEYKVFVSTGFLKENLLNIVLQVLNDNTN